MIQQAQAILYGLALGDALGRRTEFMSLAHIKQVYGKQGIQAPPDPGEFTDDTQMTIRLTEGLLQAGLTADPDRQMQAIGRQFIDWMRFDPPRAPGRTCIAGVARFESGMPWRESGILASKGCGSAMRVATIGYLYQRDEKRLREVAEASGVITHRHPAAITASIAGAYLVKLALDGVPLEDYIPLVLAFTAGISEEFDAAIRRAGQVLEQADEEVALEVIGEGWVGEEAIALALYCVLRYPDDYVACVRRAANTNGDSDSIACIAGGIMGARLGLEAIPAEWRTRCERRDYLAELGARMAQARGS
jgi:ADP-ribosylglycohydrolase